MRKAMTAIVAALVTIALTSCGAESDGPKELYHVTLYGGGTIIREWEHVDSYYRYSDGRTGMRVDGEWCTVVGGTLVIEEEE